MYYIYCMYMLYSISDACVHTYMYMRSQLQTSYWLKNAWFLPKNSISRYVFLNLIHTDLYSVNFLFIYAAAVLQATQALRSDVAYSGLLCLLGHYTDPCMLPYPHEKTTHWIHWTIVLVNDNETSVNPFHPFHFVLLTLSSAMQNTLCSVPMLQAETAE